MSDERRKLVEELRDKGEMLSKTGWGMRRLEKIERRLEEIDAAHSEEAQP